MARGKYKRKRQQTLLRTVKVQDIGLSQRVVNLLYRYKIFYVSDLLNYSKAQLAALPGMGKVSLEEIDEALGSINLHVESVVRYIQSSKEEES